MYFKTTTTRLKLKRTKSTQLKTNDFSIYWNGLMGYYSAIEYARSCGQVKSLKSFSVRLNWSLLLTRNSILHLWGSILILNGQGIDFIYQFRKWRKWGLGIIIRNQFKIISFYHPEKKRKTMPKEHPFK